MTAGRKRIAAVGTRNLDRVPWAWTRLFADAVCWAAERGYLMRTGAAPGADQHAVVMALHARGSVELVLPWEGWQRDFWEPFLQGYPERVVVEVYRERDHPEAAEALEKHHPAPDRVSGTARPFLIRDYGIVRPCSAVLALPGPKAWSGTRYTMAVARGLRIPVYDLSAEAVRLKLAEKVGCKLKPAELMGS